MKLEAETTLEPNPVETKKQTTLMRQAELEQELGVHLERVRELLVRLLHEHPRQEVERILEGMLAQIPKEPSQEELTGDHHNEEYEQAEKQLHSEREQFLGIADILKGLLMWIETPGERVRKNREHKTEGTPDQ